MEFYSSLELGAHRKYYPKSMDGDPHAIEGFFRNGINWMFSKRHRFQEF